MGLVVEQVWGGALYAHLDKLEAAFRKYQPDDYRGYASYKANDWLPKLNANKEKMDCGWKKFVWPLDPAYSNIRLIYSGMTDLNTISVQMQSYLRSGKADTLDFIESGLEKIQRVSNPYESYKPTGKPQE